jgi:hypothetical protein
MTKRKEDNLIPFTSEQNREEAKKNGVKGGKASGVARRRKKTMRELAVIVNSLPLSSKNKTQLPDGIKEDEMTFQMGFIIKVYQQALKGDTKAMKLWVELSNTLDEERNKLEIKKLKAEIKKLNDDASASTNIEDLTPLADMLKEEDENNNN